MTPHDPQEPEESPGEGHAPRIRLQRYLAACGLGSRRACEQFITDGRVTVDGDTIAELGAAVDPEGQTVALDGEKLKLERKRYYVLNKPPGYLCTNYDPGGRRRVLDLLPPGGPRLFTVGRLDENSTGLLIVTNDGDFAEQLAHPRHQIFRTYHVQVAGHPKREVYEQLKQGMFFTEGKFRVLGIKSLKKVGQSAWLEVVLSEGQNRELRRLFARVGHKVLKLARVSFGALKLGKLKMGEFRDLTTREIATLRELVDRVGSGKRRGPAKGRGPKKKPGSRPGRGRPESKGPRSEGGRSGKSGPGRSGRPGSKRPRR